MANTNIKKSTKVATIVTYSIALVCLLAGFIAPLYGVVGNAPYGQSILAVFLPDALNKALGINLITGSFVAEHSLSASASEIFGLQINFVAWAILFYALITIVGLIMLIPVICGKKNKKTSAVCAYVVEVIAAVVLSAYLIHVLKYYGGGDFAYYNFVLALGGTLLMLIVQSIINKGKLGVIKTFVFVLSLIVVLALYPLSLWIPALGELFSKFTGAINSVDAFSNYLPFVYGVSGIQLIIHPSDTIEMIKVVETYDKILIIAVILTSLMAVLNYFIDLLGLATGKKRNKNGTLAVNAGSKIFGLVRYAIQLLAACLTIIALLLLKRDFGAQIGVYLYLITLISLILVIIAIIRVARIKKIKRKVKEEEKLHFSDGELEKEYSEDVEVIGNIAVEETAEAAPAPVIAEPVEETATVEETTETAETVAAEQPVTETVEETATEPVAETQTVEETVTENEGAAVAYESEPVTEDKQLEIPVDESPKEETYTVVYNFKTVYNGPSDTFMDSLTDEEKIEFVKVFVEKSKCELPAIPDYEIGGDNSDFFPAIFIYLNKFRAILSGNLLAKIYSHINSVK